MASVTGCNNRLDVLTNPGPFPQLPKEEGERIFFYMSNKDVHICCRVNKVWDELGCRIFLQKIAFGSRTWDPLFDSRRADIKQFLPRAYHGLIKTADFHYENSQFQKTLNAYQNEEFDFAEMCDLAEKLDKMGAFLILLKCPEEAVCYHQQSIRVRENYWGGEPDDRIAADLMNLGMVLQNLGTLEHLKKAHKCYKKSLNMKKSLKEQGSHSDIVLQLGFVSQQLGNFKTAFEYYDTLRKAEEELYNEEPPFNIVAALNNLGVISQKLGNFELALKYHERALELKKRFYKEEFNLSIADSLNNLAFVYLSLGKFKISDERYRQSLEKMEKLPEKKSHFACPISLSDLPIFLISSGRLDKESIHVESECFLKKTHYVTFFQGWGQCLGRLGRFEEALEKQKKALDIQIEIHGDKHWSTALTLRDIAISLYSLGKYQEAFNEFWKTLNIQKDLFGSEYHEVGETLHYLAICHAALGNVSDAGTNQEEALSILTKCYGESHFLVATALSNMGSYLFCQRKYEQALQKYSKALAIREEKLDRKHPDVLFCKASIDICQKAIESMNCEMVPANDKKAKLTPSDFQELIVYAMGCLSTIGNRSLEKNPSGFLRIRLDPPPNFRFSSQIECLRIHYWPGNITIPIVEAMHNHPRRFESMILKGGYTHALYQKGEEDGDSTFRMHRIVKCNDSKIQRNIFCLGSVPLKFLKKENVQQDDIIVFHKQLIHQVIEYQKGTLTINVVFKSEDDLSYDVFMQKDIYTDPQIERDYDERGETINKIIEILNESSKEKLLMPS